MTARLVPGACPLCGPSYPGVAVAHAPDFEHRVTGAQEFRFNRCTTCGTLVLDPRPADEEIAGLYPPDYVSYRFDQLNPVMRRGRDLVQRGKTSVIARVAPEGGTIVDVGCGTGTLLRQMRDRYGSRFRLIGWDYPGPHLERLAASGIDVISAPIDPQHVPTAVESGFSQSTDVESGFSRMKDVDVFVLNQTVEHVPHPERLLTMLASALVPGGHIFIETPDTESLDARWFAGRYWGGYHMPRHMVLFNQRNLRDLVKRSGLQTVESTHLASPAFWVQSMRNRLLESRVPGLASLFTLGNAPLMAGMTAFDLLIGRIAGTSNQRLVARRPKL